jgi:hypothetical protein
VQRVIAGILINAPHARRTGLALGPHDGRLEPHAGNTPVVCAVARIRTNAEIIESGITKTGPVIDGPIFIHIHIRSNLEPIGDNGLDAVGQCTGIAGDLE